MRTTVRTIVFQFQLGDLASRGVRERVHDANLFRQFVVGQVLTAEPQYVVGYVLGQCFSLSRIDVVEKGSTGRWPVVFGGSPNTFRLPVSRSLIRESRQRAAKSRRAGDRQHASRVCSPKQFSLKSGIAMRGHSPYGSAMSTTLLTKPVAKRAKPAAVRLLESWRRETAYDAHAWPRVRRALSRTALPAGPC